MFSNLFVSFSCWFLRSSRVVKSPICCRLSEWRCVKDVRRPIECDNGLNGSLLFECCFKQTITAIMYRAFNCDPLWSLWHAARVIFGLYFIWYFHFFREVQNVCVRDAMLRWEFDTFAGRKWMKFIGNQLELLALVDHRSEIEYFCSILRFLMLINRQLEETNQTILPYKCHRRTWSGHWYFVVVHQQVYSMWFHRWPYRSASQNNSFRSAYNSIHIRHHL